MVSERGVSQGGMQSLGEGCGLKERDMVSWRDSGRETWAKGENGDLSQLPVELHAPCPPQVWLGKSSVKIIFSFFQPPPNGDSDFCTVSHLPRDYTEETSRTFFPGKEVI